MRTVVSADPVDSTVSLAEGEAGRDASDAELLRLVAGGSEAAFVALWESDHTGGECQLGKRHSFQPRTSRVRGVCSPCKERVGCAYSVRPLIGTFRVPDTSFGTPQASLVF